MHGMHRKGALSWISQERFAEGRDLNVVGGPQRYPPPPVITP